MTRKALGRGIEALIPRPLAEPRVEHRVERGMLPVDRIHPNPRQPRRSSDPVKMDELVRSVQARGVLEPLLVRPVGDGYELVAGERRLRAAQRAGMTEVPAIIVDIDDKSSLEVSLVENIQREDLNPVDEARAYQILADEFGRTHDEIAVQVGKDRSTVTNLLRLLRLPPEVLGAVANGSLSVGHARAILGLPRQRDQERWARRVVKRSWSVREAERRIAQATRPRDVESGTSTANAERDPHLARVEEAVRRRTGAEAHLHLRKGGGGSLELCFADQEDLERILELLGVQVH